MVKNIVCKKFLGSTTGIGYGANPQYVGNVEALIDLEDGQRLKAVLFIDWCPSAHKTDVIINTAKASKDLLKALGDSDSLMPMRNKCDFMFIKYKHFSI